MMTVAVVVIVVLALVASTAAAVRQTLRPRQAPPTPRNELAETEEHDGAVAFVCPIHPDHTSEIAGTCPRDGMALVRATPYDVRDYELDFRTEPPVVQPGEPTTLRFRVAHPGTGEPIDRFEVVHDRRYHLFVVSQDMEHFEHIHPEQDPTGTWSIEVTLPKAGYYTVLSDFVPSGGSSQFIARSLVTAGYAGDLVGDGARLVPDTVLTKTVDDMTARVSYDPPTFLAGLYGHMTFHLTDAASGRPIVDLQTYLGAFGHTLVLSEDMVDYVHSHPINLHVSDDESDHRLVMLPMGVDPETLRGGPEITFDGLMPRPGRYRAFTQFRRHDVLYTFTYTFAVAAQE